MIPYNPRNWLLPIFQLHRSDTFRKLLVMLLFIILFSGGIVYLELEHLRLGETSNARNITLMHTLLGFAISMLLVFRTNTAYDRWWEGRKLWGSLINNSRNLALKLQALLPEEEHAFFREMIPHYALVLQRHLQGDPVALPDPLSTAAAQAPLHVPNALAAALFARVADLQRSGQLSAEALIVLNEELRSFTDICGACERIKNTPIPYSYSAFIKKFIFLYVVTLPLGLAFSLGYFTIPVTAFIFYVLASLELIAEEIEDPFGKDSNDLPMERMTDTIRQNIGELLRPVRQNATLR